MLRIEFIRITLIALAIGTGMAATRIGWCRGKIDREKSIAGAKAVMFIGPCGECVNEDGSINWDKLEPFPFESAEIHVG